jgi:hypothetical protein
MYEILYTVEELYNNNKYKYKWSYTKSKSNCTYYVEQCQGQKSMCLPY